MDAKCRAPEYVPNFDLVDESTARTIMTNIRNAGVEAMYFRRYDSYSTFFGRTQYPNFIEPSYVVDPAYKVAP